MHHEASSEKLGASLFPRPGEGQDRSSQRWQFAHGALRTVSSTPETLDYIVGITVKNGSDVRLL